MRRHTDECRRTATRFAADPSQQIARLSGTELCDLVTGADHLFVNDHEPALLRDKTGWTQELLLERVGTLVVTHGAAGASPIRAGIDALQVPAVPDVDVVDPTGGGDAFRAGYPAGLAHRLLPERAAQLGCALASVVLETVGTQECRIEPRDLVSRPGFTYGRRCVDEIAPLIAWSTTGGP
ncbi:PfkB family carbohydrate kinase [Catenuloplanes japonicus]|uniref:PfkB family carbohydrate kinase n=1 Tax=Catenuloplanes japonicus TaxID=33876 RepID=UPI00068BCBF2|nr:PfkB family carbohydrate kinase [Catenuloplanes japonicus]